MRIIPVIDLKGGEVVLAKLGQRHLYAPIRTRLSQSAEPLRVAEGLMRLHNFTSLYIADLDAIAGHAPHSDHIDAIEHRFPALTLWVDAGFAEPQALDRFLSRHRAHAVLGSESQETASLVETHADDPRVILSLDFRDDDFQGPPSLLETSLHWPGALIIMTLGRVGGDKGPDLERFAGIKRRAGHRAVYAAGGVRNEADLHAVRQAGAAGVLVASALHDGRLARTTLDEFAQP